MRHIQVTWKEYHSVIIKIDSEEDFDQLKDKITEYAITLDDVYTYKEIDSLVIDDITGIDISNDTDIVVEYKED